MPSIVNTPISAGVSNQWGDLLPESTGSNRLHLVFCMAEMSSGTEGNVHDTFSMNGVSYQKIASQYALSSTLRTVTAFAAKEADILLVEAGSGGQYGEDASGNEYKWSSGNGAVCLTLQDVDQSVELTTVFAEAGPFSSTSVAFPHNVSISANSGDFVVTAAITTQNSAVTYTDSTEIADRTVSSTFNMSLAAHEATSTGTETIGVTADGGTSYATLLTSLALPGVGQANQAPTANDDTFSIQDNVSNGAVVGTYTATDADGTVDSYSVTGTTLAIDNAGQITIADNTGITAGTPIVETVTATDNEGATDTATITVNVTSATAFSVDSVSAGPYYVGDTVTLTVSNASASGKTLSIPAGSLTVDSQSTSQMTFTVPDPKTFGDQTSPYSSNILITATDGVENDTINFQISPTVGHYFETITATTGIYADDVGVAIGDRSYGYWLSGTGDAFLTVGALNSPLGGTFRYWLQDDTDSTWGAFADEVMEDFRWRGSFIPSENRGSINQIAYYLLSTGEYQSTQVNDIIKEWLLEEGYVGAINQMLYNFLGDAGYNGTLQDRMITWSKEP